MKGKGWVHHKGVDSPKGVFRAFQENPDSIHCWEDCEEMYKHAIASNLLRDACGEEDGRQRIIKWHTDKEDSKIIFTGGVIIISNENLSKSNAALKAVASRAKPIQWTLNNREMIACIIDISSNGWNKRGKKLTSDQCAIVAQHLITKMTSGEGIGDVDLRFFTEHCLPAYSWFLARKVLNENGEVDETLSGQNVSWKEVIDSKLIGEVGIPETRDERNEFLQKVAVEIDLQKLTVVQKHELWTEKTGLAKAMYHRHLSRAKKNKEGEK
jgi:hypothetical protein